MSDKIYKAFETLGVEKALPVGYINKNGYQKQSNGTWKYVKSSGKGKSAGSQDNMKPENVKPHSEAYQKQMETRAAETSTENLQNFIKRNSNPKDNIYAKKELEYRKTKVEHLQLTRNDFYNRGLTKQAEAVQQAINEVGKGKKSK